MKGKIFKTLSALLITATLAAVSVMPALAANYPTDKQATGTTTTFKKYFVVKQDVEFPSAVFEYTIVPGDAVEPTPTTMEVFPGPTGATVGTADFTTAPAAADIHTTKQEGDVSLTLAADEKYAKKTVTIDFTAVKFAEPGVYRYTLQEKQCSNPAISCDTTEYSVDVYVIDTDGTLSVRTYIIHPGTEAPASTTGTTATTVNGKIDGITNRYPTTGLYFAKKVAGNQGSRDKYFKFTVALTDLPAGTVLTVDLSNADATSGSNSATAEANRNQENVTTLTADATGKVSHDFYLQNDQYIAIYGLTEGSKYNVTEAAEDYESADAETTAITIGSKTFDDATSDTMSDEDVYTGFTNTRQGVIPTGILISAAPVIIVGVVVVAGIAFFAVRSAKRKASEADTEEQ